MAVAQISPRRPITRRKFLNGSLIAAAGLAVYAGEIERHFIEVTLHDVGIAGLPAAFEGVRIAQLSDIHMDEFSEPMFVEHAVKLVNELEPDYVFLTGDYVTHGLASRSFEIGSAWQCANILRKLNCRQRYAVLGNHDLYVSQEEVTAALLDNEIQMLVNACFPLERQGGRIWLAGVIDPCDGRPNIRTAIPKQIHGIAHEPIVLLCHAPDWVDNMLKKPEGQFVSLMLSGHTHGGQVRLPFIGATFLPPCGKRYVEGWFRFNQLQLYVNRGLGSVGVPFRFNCPPEITLFTLRRAEPAA